MHRLIVLLSLLCTIGCAADPVVTSRRSVEQGDQLAAAGKLSEALIAYRVASQATPMKGEVRLKLAQVYARTGDHAKAYAEYVRAADLMPDNIDAQGHTAMYLLLSARFEEARTRADAILLHDPRHIDLLLIRAHAYAGLKDFTHARNDVDAALALDASRDSTYVEVELAQGHAVEAEAAFVQGTTVQPRSVKARLALANFYAGTRRVDLALTVFADALRIDPKDLTANRSLASFYLQAGRTAEAEQPLAMVVAVAPSAASRFALADYYLAAARLPEAEQALLPLDAPRTEAVALAGMRTRLAAIRARQGKVVEATRLLDVVLAADGRHVEALLAKSALLAATPAGLAEARTLVAKAIESDPQSAAAHYAAGKLSLLRNDYDAAGASFRDAVRSDSRASGAQFELSRLELATGGTEAAVQFAQQAVAAQPASLENHLQLATALLGHHELARAKAALTVMQQRWPKASAVHALAGLLAREQRDYAGARREYAVALAGAAATPDAVWGAVAVELAAGDLAGAQRVIDEQLRARPKEAMLHVFAGRVHAARKDLVQAERALLRALELDADALPAYETLAAVYMAGGRLDDARARFDSLSQKQPNAPGPATMAAMLVQLQGRTDEARTRYEKILARDERAGVAANNLAWLYADAGTNLEAAVQLAQSAVQQMPESAEVNDTLGWAYYRKGLSSLALRPFRQSAAKDPANPVYQYHLGLALAQVGEGPKARQALQQALLLARDFPGADDARRVLATLGS